MIKISDLSPTNQIPLHQRENDVVQSNPSVTQKVTQVIKVWPIVNGQVSLENHQERIRLNITKNGIFQEVSLEAIRGIPQRVFNSPDLIGSSVKDSYCVPKKLDDGTYSLHIFQRGHGGMFSPKVWGQGVEAFAGRTPVYKAGNAMGHTDLHVAATQGWDDDVKKHIAAGADINRVNTKGNTPLDDAIQQRNTSTEKILRTHGAKRSNELQNATVSSSDKKEDIK